MLMYRDLRLQDVLLIQKYFSKSLEIPKLETSIALGKFGGIRRVPNRNKMPLKGLATQADLDGNQHGDKVSRKQSPLH